MSELLTMAAIGVALFVRFDLSQPGSVCRAGWQALRDRARPVPVPGPAAVVEPGPLPGADTGEWVDMEALIAELAHGLRAADLDVLDADEVHPLPAGPMPLAELPRPAVPLALPGGQGKALIAREIDDPSLANTVAIRPTDLGWALDTTRSPS